MQLLKLRGLDDPRIESWLSKKTNKYTSHEAQNEILKTMAISTLRKIANDVLKMSPSERQLIEVCNLLQLLVVMPATNAVSERSFSALRRVKNYLRSSMTQERPLSA